jgi:hypothetical protein
MSAEKISKQPQKKLKSVEKESTADRDNIADDQEVCNKAPEWAEHQRLWEDDEPCDDGRSGKLGE